MLDLLRRDPTDDARLVRVVRWANEREGAVRLAEALLVEGASATDRFAAGRLLEAGGRPDRALDAYEGAVAADPDSPARHRLVELWLRAGRADRAAALAAPLDDLPLALRLPLLVARGPEGRAAAEALLDDSTIDLATRIELARGAGLDARAAELAEAQGDLSTACTAWLDAGRPDRALALLDRVLDSPALDNTSAVVPRATRLALARWSGDPGRLPADAPRSDRETLARSLGHTDPETDPDTTGVSPSDGRVPDLAEPGDGATDPRLAAARAILERTDDPDSDRARLAALDDGGPPSLTVALAWALLGEEERAHDEVSRWRLLPRPGEEAARRALERRHPAWWGLHRGADATIVEAERHDRFDAPAELEEEIDRALLASAPGSATEAVLLYHRGRLFPASRGESGRSVGDLERARAIAPEVLVRRPIDEALDGLSEGIRIEPLATATIGTVPHGMLVPDALPITELHGLRSTVRHGEAIGGIQSEDGTVRPLHLASRPPPAAYLTGRRFRVIDWQRLDPETPALPASIDPSTHPLAPVRAWVGSSESTLVVGRGLALHGADGALLAAIELPAPLDARSLPPEVVRLIHPELETLADDLRGTPTADLRTLGDARDVWSRVLAREELPPATTPEAVSVWWEGGSGGVPRIAIIGAGLRITLEATPAPEVPPLGNDLTAALDATLPRGLRVWSADTRSSDDVGKPDDTGSRPRTTPFEVSTRRRVSSSTAEAPRVDPFPSDTEAPALSPEGNPFDVVRELETWTLSFARDGWIVGSRDGAILWCAHLDPPLPGAHGWRARRPERENRRRRGPDRTGPTSSAGTAVVQRLGTDLIAIRTDRVHLFDSLGHLRTEATRPRTVLRDVSAHRRADGALELAVLPEPGDAVILGERRIPLPAAGAFDIELFEDRIDVLAYDPFQVALVLLSVDREHGTVTRRTLPPSAVVEEDRADQRPFALGRLGETLLLAGRGSLVARVDGAWVSLLPTDAPRSSAWLPAHAWQTAPVVRAGRLVVAWPWGEVLELELP